MQISDVKQKKVYARLEERDWLLINEDKRPSMITSGNTFDLTGRSDQSQSGTASNSFEREFQIIIQAKQGIGLSFVSREPYEELLYAFMSNVVLDYQATSSHIILDGSVQVIEKKTI